MGGIWQHLHVICDSPADSIMCVTVGKHEVVRERTTTLRHSCLERAYRAETVIFQVKKLKNRLGLWRTCMGLETEPSTKRQRLISPRKMSAASTGSLFVVFCFSTPTLFS